MRLATTLGCLMGALAVLTACPADDAPPRADLAPGLGVTVDGQLLTLGDEMSTIAARLGEPSRRRDLGDLGLRFWYDDHGVSGLLSGSADGATVVAVYGSEGFAGRTADDIGVGSSRADVEAVFGTPRIDTVAGNSWYRDRGIAFRMNDDRVAAVHLFAPATAEP